MTQRIRLSRPLKAEINGDFSRTLRIFPSPVFNAPDEGVPLDFGIGARGQKNSNDGLPD